MVYTKLVKQLEVREAWELNDDKREQEDERQRLMLRLKVG